LIREGTNTAIEFYNFVILLERKLREQYGQFSNGFKKNLIIVFDNASIHKEEHIVRLLKQKGLMAITTPAYTPEMNPIERYFRLLKSLYGRSDLGHR
jgi:transposase